MASVCFGSAKIGDICFLSKKNSKKISYRCSHRLSACRYWGHPSRVRFAGARVRGYSLRSNPRLLSVDGFTVLLAAQQEERRKEECPQVECRKEGCRKEECRKEECRKGECRTTRGMPQRGMPPRGMLTLEASPLNNRGYERSEHPRRVSSITSPCTLEGCPMSFENYRVFSLRRKGG